MGDGHFYSCRDNTLLCDNLQVQVVIDVNILDFCMVNRPNHLSFSSFKSRFSADLEGIHTKVQNRRYLSRSVPLSDI